jgi:hypothetical protein
MKPLYETNPFHPLDEPELMPLDRLVFDTNLKVNPAVIAAPPEHVRNIRRPKSLPSDPTEYDRERTIFIDLPPNGSIRVAIADLGDDDFRLRRVELNPGCILYHHNGLLLTTDQVVTAFTIVCEKIQPLLANPDDTALLIPGCHRKSPSYWSAIEIDMHLHDPEGTLLLALRNARHPAIRKKATVFEGESITLGTRRGELMINLYRKDIEMARDLEKFDIEDPNQVLRVEVTLRKQKLLHYLGDEGNTAKLASHHARGKSSPQPRLVRFRASQAMKAHMQITSELRGISQVTAKRDLPGDDKTGRLVGLIARHTSTPVETLLDLYRLRFSPARNTMTRMRFAAIHELSLATDETAALFTDERYANQPVISIPQLEAAAPPGRLSFGVSGRDRSQLRHAA